MAVCKAKQQILVCLLLCFVLPATTVNGVKQISKWARDTSKHHTFLTEKSRLLAGETLQDKTTLIPEAASHKHEVSYPRAAPPTPGTTAAAFPLDPDFIASMIRLNMDKLALFMPLVNTLKSYFDLNWFSNSAFLTVINQSLKVLLQEFPKVLESKVVHGTIDAVIAEMGRVNFTGVNMSDAGDIVKSAISRLSYSNILAKYYELMKNNSAIPDSPSLKSKLESMLLNFTMVTLPAFIRNPLVQDISNLVETEFMAVNLTGVDTSNAGNVLRAVASQVNWPRLLNGVDIKLRPQYPVVSDLLGLVGKQLLSVNLSGVNTSNIIRVFQAFAMQIDWLTIFEGFYSKFRTYNPLIWDIEELIWRELLTVNLTGINHLHPAQVVQAISARTNWIGMLQGIYAKLHEFNVLPEKPTLPSLISTSLLNITFGAIPRFLANPLTWQIGGIILEEVQSLDYSKIDPSDTGQSVKAILSQINVGQIYSKINALSGMQGASEALPVVSPQCRADTAFLLTNLVSLKPWALAMADAFGKPGAGILKGNLYEIGNYDQCLATTAFEEHSWVAGTGPMTSKVERFKGEFCRVTFNLPKSFVDGLGVDTKGIPVRLSWGICAPSTCNESDVKGVLTTGLLSRFNLDIQEVYCGSSPQVKDDPSASAAIGVLAFLIFLIIAGTAVDVIYNGKNDANSSDVSEKKQTNGVVNGGYVSDERDVTKVYELSTFTNQRRENGDISDKSAVESGQLSTKHKSPKSQSIVVRIFTSFSIVSNVPKVLAASHSKGSITCIHGIRYLSMAWIMLCHTFYFGIFSISDNQTAENMLDATKYLQRFTFMPIIYGTFSVDTFFLLSGFLVAYLFFKDLDKRKSRLNCAKMVVFYVHRFWRLTPIYMIILMAFSCLYPYLASGPLFPRLIQDAENCKTNWWTNLLYVNNLVNDKQMCMGWSWYLANDMQFYIISPVFILALYFFPVIGIILCLLLVAASITSTAIIEDKGAGNMLSTSQIPKPGEISYYYDIYVKPWCRVGAYAIGLLLAKLVHHRGKKPFNKLIALCGWLDALLVGLFLVYISYTELKEGAEPWSQSIRTAYESICRPLFSAAVAWVIFACHSGMGGVINSILSFKGFIPLGRLTYAAYLIHPILMVVFMYTRRALIHLDDYSMVYLYLGHECLAFAAAFILSVAFESPFLNLEKIVLKAIGK
ncbi:O-acyltransferase like protein-like [Liolophura sinensis]|uniref:O-acyltransferase like protein-like n=1 Tax=Liolophura sinensis TaxID=3198878 RepID=UPI003158C0C0